MYRLQARTAAAGAGCVSKEHSQMICAGSACLSKGAFVLGMQAGTAAAACCRVLGVRPDNAGWASSSRFLQAVAYVCRERMLAKQQQKALARCCLE